MAKIDRELRYARFMQRGPKPRIPDCHPDRKHYGKGMCASCFQMDWRKRHPKAAEPPKLPRVPECGHPDRKYAAKGLCGSCYQVAWAKAHPDATTGNAWSRANPERARAQNRKYHLWHKHRTRVEQYVEAWHAQEGRCANPGCGADYPLELNDHRKGLHVDHDHITGRFRALLCPGCNVALGQVGDDPARLRGLVEYLESHSVH